MFRIPMSICNLRCHYCYLAQRDEHYQGIQPPMKYTPEEVAYALRPERIGGLAFMNFCADGETLLVKDLDKYIRKLVEEGHYAEIVTNMTITPMLNKILSWPKDLLKHVEFKCSFHYLELKKRGLLDVFATNVKDAWNAGASASVEVTPSDELIPYIDELKNFSLENFGALPHLTIARDDRTNGIDYLTELPIDEYDKIWSQFNSDFWKFKKTIFGIKRKEFCYAGMWGLYIDLTTGDCNRCYYSPVFANVFDSPDSKFPESPIVRCPIAHCYNGHAYLTLGYIPSLNSPGFGDLRNRIRVDRTEWLQPELKDFFNSKLIQENQRFSLLKENTLKINSNVNWICRKAYSRMPQSLKNIFHKLK